MRTSDFDYPLPEELIAQRPLQRRSASRLLYVPGDGDVEDRFFSELPQLLQPGDLLVFNDTRVFPARVFGRKTTGGRIELLVERILGDRRALVHIRASKSPKAGAVLELPAGVRASVGERQGELFNVTFDCEGTLLEYLEQVGRMPLPPYIVREDEVEDAERYQTVYAQRTGAVAAPTAGLHFDEALLDKLQERGIGQAYVTLHVGAGTFQPVRVERVQDHYMHAEQFEVSDEVCRRIAETRARGGRVVAVGTTVVRSLETAAAGGELQPFTGETNLFITPGYRFRCIDALITNFHLPRSSLLMLVCAFGGYERIMHAYRHAVWRRYRFFSYGDAMLIEKNEKQNSEYRRQDSEEEESQ
jgi:S-adenosylmethionine:tRNA ribosyltransferase-isomerase